MLEIQAYTDGSCLGNPGVGGYAAVMLANGLEKVCKGYEPGQTTNNRMELRAAINVLKWCNRVQKEPCKITFYTDSQYLVNCFNHNWSELTSVSRANNDLWVELVTESMNGKHEISFVKVKGHDGLKMNEKADKLARAEAVKARHVAYGC